MVSCCVVSCCHGDDGWWHLYTPAPIYTSTVRGLYNSSFFARGSDSAPGPLMLQHKPTWPVDGLRPYHVVYKWPSPAHTQGREDIAGPHNRDGLSIKAEQDLKGTDNRPAWLHHLLHLFFFFLLFVRPMCYVTSTTTPLRVPAV